MEDLHLHEKAPKSVWVSKDFEENDSPMKYGLDDPPALVSPCNDSYRKSIHQGERTNPHKKYQALSTLIKNLCQASGLSPAMLHHVLGETINDEITDFLNKDSATLHRSVSTQCSELVSHSASGIGSEGVAIEKELNCKVSEIGSNFSIANAKMDKHEGIENSCVISSGGKSPETTSKLDEYCSSPLPLRSVPIENSSDNWWLDESMFLTPTAKHGISPPSLPSTPTLKPQPISDCFAMDTHELLEPLDDMKYSSPILPTLNYGGNIGEFQMSTSHKGDNAGSNAFSTFSDQFSLENILENPEVTVMNSEFPNMGASAEINKDTNIFDEWLADGFLENEDKFIRTSPTEGVSNSGFGFIEKSGSNKFFTASPTPWLNDGKALYPPGRKLIPGQSSTQAARHPGNQEAQETSGLPFYGNTLAGDTSGRGGADIAKWTEGSEAPRPNLPRDKATYQNYPNQTVAPRSANLLVGHVPYVTPSYESRREENLHKRKARRACERGQARPNKISRPVIASLDLGSSVRALDFTQDGSRGNGVATTLQVPPKPIPALDVRCTLPNINQARYVPVKPCVETLELGEVQTKTLGNEGVKPGSASVSVFPPKELTASAEANFKPGIFDLACRPGKLFTSQGPNVQADSLDEKRHGGTHAVAAKIRRERMNSKLKSLQSIVPGAIDMTTEGFLLHTMSYINDLQTRIKASMEKKFMDKNICNKEATKLSCLERRGLIICSVAKVGEFV